MLNIGNWKDRIHLVIKSNAGGFWIALSQLILLLANFILLKLLTLNLSIEDFGYYSLCMSIVLFVRQVLYDPISIIGGKKVGAGAKNPKDISTNFQIIRLITDYLGLAILVTGFVFWFLVGSVINRSFVGPVVCICTFYLCANAAQGVYINLFNSFGDRKAAALFSIADSVLKVSLVIGVIFLLTTTFINVLIIISISTFLIFLCMRFYILERFTIELKFRDKLNELAKQNILISVPLYLPILFAAFKSVSDRWVLTLFTGVDELAAYSVLLQIGYSPVLLFFGVVQTYLGPKIYQISSDCSAKGRQELKNFISKVLLSVFIVTCIATVMAIFISKWLFILLTGQAYHNLSIYTPIFVLSGGLAALTGMLQVVALGALEVKSVGRLIYLSVFFSAGIFLFFVYIWGFLGAIAALLITGATSVALYFFSIYRDLY